MRKVNYHLFVLLITALSVNSCGKMMRDFHGDQEDADSPFDEEDSKPKTSSVQKNRTESRQSELGQRRGSKGDERSEVQKQSAFVSSFPEDRPALSSGTNPIYLPATKRAYKNGSRATRDDFIDQSQEEGSLWASSAQTNYYFTKNKNREPGDLLSIIIEQDLMRDIEIEIKRTLSYREKDNELSMAQELIRSKFLAEKGLIKKDEIALGAAAPESPNNTGQKNLSSSIKASPSPSASSVSVTDEAKSELNLESVEKLVPKVTLNDVDLSKSIELKSGDTMMGEIVERYSNGNYKVRTIKRVVYKNGPPRLVSVVGIVKGLDISEETDVIHSGRLYEYHVEVAH